MDERYLSRADASEYLTHTRGLPTAKTTLQKLASVGGGPRYRRFGNRSVYRIYRVTGDRYGGEWCREPFTKHGIKYELAEKPRSDLYRDLLPLINGRLIELLDHSKLITQLCSLERRTARSGRDSIDHAPGSHDDVANAVAGVATMRKQTRDYSAML